MAYNFEKRHNRLSTRMRELNSRPVQYRRGGSVLFTASATVYELRTDELIAFGVSLDSRRMDYLFRTVDMPIGFEPNDDRDEIYDAAEDLMCKVSPLGDEAHFRWTSHTRIAMRIHTHAATFSIPQSELDLSGIVTQSLVSAVQATVTNLPMVAVTTKSTVGVVLTEYDMDPVFTGSTVGEIEPELTP